MRAKSRRGAPDTGPRPAQACLRTPQGLAIAFPELSTPLTHAGVYVHDEVRATSRLTLNVGLRYDVAAGYVIDQSRNPTFAVMQQTAQAGRFRGVPVFEDFAEMPAGDYNNLQPRFGFAFDLRGDGRDVVRGGWGIFTDPAYTNANILFAADGALGAVPLRSVRAIRTGFESRTAVSFGSAIPSRRSRPSIRCRKSAWAARSSRRGSGSRTRGRHRSAGRIKSDRRPP